MIPLSRWILFVPSRTPLPSITIFQVPSRSPLEFVNKGIIRLVASNGPLLTEAAVSLGM